MAAELYKVCKLSETGLMNLECGISRYCILDFLLHKNYDLCSKKCAARIELLRIVIFEKKAKKILEDDEISILVDLNMGNARGNAWGCDLSYDYVRINGSYRN